MRPQQDAESLGSWHTLFWGIGAYWVLSGSFAVATFVYGSVLASTLGADAGKVPATELAVLADPSIVAVRALMLSFWIAAPLLVLLARAATRSLADWKSYIGLKPAPVRSLLVCGALLVGAFLLSGALDKALGRSSTHAFASDLVLAAEGAWLIPVLFSLVLLGPFCEELLFRGLLLSGLSRSALGSLGASLLVAGLFVASHFQYMSSYVVEVFVLGLALCALRIAYDSIGPPLVLHALNNLGAWLYSWFLLGGPKP